jgi:hypothetical protein
MSKICDWIDAYPIDTLDALAFIIGIAILVFWARRDER